MSEQITLEQLKGLCLEMFKQKAAVAKIKEHKTAEEKCKDFDFCTFDIEKSGCMLAWDYFFPGPMILPALL